MALGWITGIILFVAVGALALVGAIALYNANEEKHPGYCKTVDEVKVKKLTKRGTWSIILAVIMFLVFIVVPFSFHTVDTGEVAVVKELGRVKEVKTSGTYFDLWITKLKPVSYHDDELVLLAPNSSVKHQATNSNILSTIQSAVHSVFNLYTEVRIIEENELKEILGL